MPHHDTGISLHSLLVKSGLDQTSLLPVELAVRRKQSIAEDVAQILIELAAREITRLVDQKIANMFRSKEQHDRCPSHMDRRQPTKGTLNAADKSQRVATKLEDIAHDWYILRARRQLRLDHDVLH
jgi:hypothetical protein